MNKAVNAETIVYLFIILITLLVSTL